MLAMLGNSSAFAQTIVDSSAKTMPPADLQQVLRLLAGQIMDTTGAQVRGLYKSSATHGYCGQLKARGAYTEWSPFHANIYTNTVWILSKAASPEAYKDVHMRVFAFGCIPRR